MRFSEPGENWYLPEPEQMQAQSRSNKQGSGDMLDPGAASAARRRIKGANHQARQAVESLQEHGLTRERARFPVNMNYFTTVSMTISAHNLMRVLRQRLDLHAQWEIRMYAEMMRRIFETWLPYTAQAFYDYQLNSMTLSASEIALMSTISKYAVEDGIVRWVPGDSFVELDVTRREWRDFKKKYNKLTGHKVRLAGEFRFREYTT